MIHISKTELMERVIRSKGTTARESFEHSILGAFDITATRQYCIDSGLLPSRMLIPEDHLDGVFASRDYEEERVQVFVDSKINTRRDPCISVRTDDGQIVMLDGIHRVVAAHRLGNMEYDDEMQCNVLVFYSWLIELKNAKRVGEEYHRPEGYSWGNPDFM